jgi:ABC-2 type transport system permease protein
VTPYLAMFSARFRMLLQYRVAALAGVSTQLFWGLIRMMIFQAFYLSSTATQPMTMQETVNYVWLGQGMLVLVMFGIDTEIRAMIRTGTVAYEMIRPVDLYGFWYSRSVALRTAPLLMRMVPVFAFAALFCGLQAPASRASGALFLLSTVAAILLSSAVATAMTVSMLWTVAGEGITRLAFGIIFVLSGIIVPLPLFPDWAQSTIAFLPFRGLADTPFRIYMGHIAPAAAMAAIAHQALWTLGFVAFGRWLLARGCRRLVVQGG